MKWPNADHFSRNWKLSVCDVKVFIKISGLRVSFKEQKKVHNTAKLHRNIWSGNPKHFVFDGNESVFVCVCVRVNYFNLNILSFFFQLKEKIQFFRFPLASWCGFHKSSSGIPFIVLILPFVQNFCVQVFLKRKYLFFFLIF